MRRIFLLLTISLVWFANVDAQTKDYPRAAAAEIASEQPEAYPIDPRPFLEWGDEVARKAREDNPRYLTDAKGRRATTWNYSVGDEDTFWDQSLDGNNNWINIFATCRGVGENCYVFVQNSQWGDRVTQEGVDAIVDGFDNQTPADPTKGIFETLTGVYGDPPDIDNDPKIIILVLDITDGWDPAVGGGYVAGYFWSFHETLQAVNPNSNEAEIYFLDSYPGDLSTQAGIDNSLNTAAHEFQHMINWNYNPAQPSFFDEGCSMVAEHLCGYEFREQDRWANNTNDVLFEWDDGETDVLVDYSRAARFMLYFYEQFGSEFMTKFVQNEQTGQAGLDNALSNLITPTPRRFNDPVIDNNILVDWYTANYVGDKSINTKWGYDLQGLTKGAPVIHVSPNVTVDENRIESYGAQYISFVQGRNLTVNFGAVSSNLIIRAVKVADTFKVIEDVTRGVDYNVPEFGTTFHTVTFVVINKSQFGYINSPYTATGENITTGTIELAHDLGREAQGVLPITPGDTAAVVFEGVSGMWIKSIKVALRQPGMVTGGVWKYAQSSPVSPLGEEMIVPINAISTMQWFPHPYPDPFPNWVEIDVDAQHIDASDDFVVGFVVEGTYEGDGSGGNRIMETSYPGTEFYYNLNYLQNPPAAMGTVPGWYGVFPDGDGGQYIYLIRAVVTDGTVDVELEAEIPTSFALEQNYPNPFNPSTTIRYQVPELSNVSVKVYDMMGREVTTLINDQKSAGTYEVNWNGENYSGQKVSSGVYFYTIKTKDYTQSKKMVLMK